MADSKWTKVPKYKIPRWLEKTIIQGNWDDVIRTEGKNYQYKIVFDNFKNCKGQGHHPDYWVYSRKKVKQRMKGSAIVEYKDKGVLVVAGRSKKFMLPGGGANRKETRTSSAIRELEEETGLKTIETKYLFNRRGPKHKKKSGWWRNREKVFYVIAEGTPKPDRKEVYYIDYYQPGKDIELMYGAKEVIEKYYNIKQSLSWKKWVFIKEKIKKQSAYSK